MMPCHPDRVRQNYSEVKVNNVTFTNVPEHIKAECDIIGISTKLNDDGLKEIIDYLIEVKKYRERIK